MRGSSAQEESLARCTTLYESLVPQPFYRMHRKLGQNSYTDAIIYSPDVQVLREEPEEQLVESFWHMDILTCAAPNKNAMREQVKRNPHNTLVLLPKIWKQRIDRVLKVAALHNRDALVLGAWGCGVFGNDPKEVSQYFMEQLRGAHKGEFRVVEFAVPFHKKNREPFEEQLS